MQTPATPENDLVVLLDASSDPQENIEKLIATELENMQANDFHCVENVDDWRVRVEDGLSFNWAHSVNVHVINAYIQFQVHGVNGRVDFF